jgi:hypothetical protein
MPERGEVKGALVTGDHKKGPPRWLFTALTLGAFVACGIYIGIIRVEGASTGNLVRLAAFAALGLLMLWGALARRRD